MDQSLKRKQAKNAVRSIDPQAQQAVLAAVAEIRERFQTTVPRRLAILEQATSALRAGILSDALRHQAQAEAHKIAGAGGLFGCPHGSSLAKKIEAMFQPLAVLEHAHASRLAELILALRRELEQPPQQLPVA